MQSLFTLIALAPAVFANTPAAFGAFDDTFSAGQCGISPIPANLFDLSEDSTPGCMRPIPEDNSTGNRVTCILDFTFVSGTFVGTTTPPTATALVLFENAISVYEDSCRAVPQNLAYLFIDTSNLTPVFDPALTYAIAITGEVLTDPEVFSKLTNIFTVYLSNLTNIPTPITPIFVPGAPAVVAPPTPAVPPTLYIVFPAGTDFSSFFAIVAWNAVAQSVSVSVNTTLTTAVLPTFNVSITSELITTNNNTFIGTIAPETVVAPAVLAPSQLNFFPYDNYPSRSFIDLSLGYKALGMLSHVAGIDKHDFNVLSSITCMTDTLDCMIKQCRRPRCCKITPKARIQRYCALVISMFCCVPEVNRNPRCIEELCCVVSSCEEPVSAFCCCVSWLARICVKSEIVASFQTFYNDVCGYNPYFCGSFSCAEAYGLCGSDCTAVNKYCTCERFSASIEAEVECEAEIECEEETKPGHAAAPRRKSAIARYKWYIAVSVVLVISGCAAAYAALM